MASEKGPRLPCSRSALFLEAGVGAATPARPPLHGPTTCPGPEIWSLPGLCPISFIQCVGCAQAHFAAPSRKSTWSASLFIQGLLSARHLVSTYLSFLNFAKDPGLIDQTAMILGARTEPRAPTASPKLP